MAHYFTNDNVKSEERKIKVNVRNNNYTFITDNGVFSKKGLDFGTRTLLENITKVKGDVLDLGCGWGPVGIVLSKEANVDMVDINERSIKLAKKNADINNAKINVFISNVYENVNKKYDYIVTNPPIRIGKKILYEFLFKASTFLKENGELWFVMHKDQGAKSMMKALESEYKVTLITKNKGFYIIMCKKHWQVATKRL